MDTIQIKNVSGEVLYTYEKENAIIKEAVEEAVKAGISLRGADLEDAYLHRANLKGADLREAYLANAILTKADLGNALLRNANVCYANLKGASLKGASLINADLVGANLTKANLTKANLTKADLREANLTKADLREANFTKVVFDCDHTFCDINLRGAITDKKYIQVACIGSRRGITTYCFDDDIVYCGCFEGSLAEFESKVEDTHKYNPCCLKEYREFINYIKRLK